MAKVKPFLWFEDNADEAVKFYTSVFKDSEASVINKIEGAPGPENNTYTATFRVFNQEFMVLNGGPVGDLFKFNSAISFFITVDTQEEVDEYWEALSKDGGKPGQCGWITDKYGVTWQIVPKILNVLMSSPDREKANRTTKAMLKMTKLDSKVLQDAFDGKS
jgi:predicted 3-demethylubiquinone-9 3-methyltransferase (glyoxalase superfamily)